MSVSFSDVLEIRPGLTAIIGGGGKTSLLYRLAAELKSRGTVIVCTSTHIRRPEGLPVLNGADAAAVREAIRAHDAVCVGEPAAGGKLTAPCLDFEALTELADYVLAEADGSKGRPLKAHLSHEPVIPACAGQTVLVVGADGFSRPVGEACHRAERFAELAETTVDAPVTAEALARVIVKEGFGDRVFVNKAESAQALAFATELAAKLLCPTYAGSVRNGDIRPCLA